MSDILDKYSQLREELDEKDPIKRYAKLREELDEKDPIKRYARIKEEIDSIKVKNTQKFETDKQKGEEKTLEAMESLFKSLGGTELDVTDKPEITGDAEERQEVVIEEPIRDVEEINLREEQPTDIEEGEEEELDSELDPVIDAITKQESLKEKSKIQVDPVSARIEKLEKWIQKIAVSGPGSGEVRILNMDDVDTSDLANDKVLKYQSSSGKFIFATGGGGGDVDLSAVDQNIIPDGDGTRDLGSSSYKWKDLYLSGSSIKMGTTTISIDESGEFQTQKAGDSSPSKVASFSKINIPFTKANGTTSSIETKSAPTTFSAFFDNMYVPFVKSDGSDVTTLKLGS